MGAVTWGRMAVVACGVVVTAIAPRAGAPSAKGVSGGEIEHVVRLGETATSLGARFGVSVETILVDNHLPSSGAIHVGQRLRIVNRHLVPGSVERGTLVINLPQRVLFYEDEAAVHAFPVSVGRRTWQTPLASFTVASKRTDPIWTPPETIREEARRAGKVLPDRVLPGPDNPLGRYWLGLSSDGVGIHGTNAPLSIYRFATHGCVRMHPDDIEWLYARVSVGMSVRTVYEPVLLARQGDAVLLEAHPDPYRRVPDIRRAARALATASGLTDAVDWARADAVLDARHGVARVVTGSREGPP